VWDGSVVAGEGIVEGGEEDGGDEDMCDCV
jgi:hypothetical protein